RGNWRMRDERAQHFGLPSDKLTHPALVGFINRNYGCDERGCWYFQNGPQRVYLELDAAPFIVRTDPAQGWLLQTGEALGEIEEAVMTEAGELVLRSGGRVAQLDDRDAAQALTLLEMNGRPVADEELLAWLEATPDSADTAAPAAAAAPHTAAGASTAAKAADANAAAAAALSNAAAGQLMLCDGARRIVVRRLLRAQLPAYFSFVRSPLSDHGDGRAKGSAGV
ncbi:MAG: DUF2946 family protein, partial [Paucibacter sp.]|nr:DUF2946 family protein [Roseateles sp.]